MNREMKRGGKAAELNAGESWGGRWGHPEQSGQQRLRARRLQDKSASKFGSIRLRSSNSNTSTRCVQCRTASSSSRTSPFAAPVEKERWFMRRACMGSSEEHQTHEEPRGASNAWKLGRASDSECIRDTRSIGMYCSRGQDDWSCHGSCVVELRHRD